MSMRHAACTALLLTAAGSVGSQSAIDPVSFQRALLGPWHARAVHTPIGPAPYDIEFKWRDAECITGTAFNGFIHHTWTFCRDREVLKLDFLSDFRGNTTPIHFEAIAAQAGTVTFYAKSHDFMRVLVTVGERAGRFEIIHRGELHVRIELERVAESHVQ